MKGCKCSCKLERTAVSSREKEHCHLKYGKEKGVWDLHLSEAQGQLHCNIRRGTGRLCNGLFILERTSVVFGEREQCKFKYIKEDRDQSAVQHEESEC